MNPDNRVIVQIKIEDAERADEAFSILMGEQVEPRRQFIEKTRSTRIWMCDTSYAARCRGRACHPPHKNHRPVYGSWIIRFYARAKIPVCKIMIIEEKIIL